MRYRCRLPLGGIRVVSKSPQLVPEGFLYSEYRAWISQFGRADERTRTAHLLITSALFNRRRCGPAPTPPPFSCFRQYYSLGAILC
jgi:hypothetical protein